MAIDKTMKSKIVLGITLGVTLIIFVLIMVYVTGGFKCKKCTEPLSLEDQMASPCCDKKAIWGIPPKTPSCGWGYNSSYASGVKGLKYKVPKDQVNRQLLIPYEILTRPQLLTPPYPTFSRNCGCVCQF